MSVRSFWRTGLGVVVMLGVVGGTGHAKHWKLGWGGYTIGSEHDKLEWIRWDWVLINHGSISVETGIRGANEALCYNPDQKYLVRLWPISNVGKVKANRSQATFLDYHFEPEVHRKVRDQLQAEIKAVLKGISRPENVLGFTFLEELPGHWAEAVRNPDCPVLKHYGPRLAKEMGLGKFVWNARAKKHITRLYVDSLREIYAHIKSLAPGKTVFHWQHTGVATLDRGASKDLMAKGFAIHKLTEVIGRWGAHGLFTYPNGRRVWDQYLALVRKHRWPFFSQLSHPSRMRLANWSDTEKLVRVRDPLNWGTFLYCEGNCRKGPKPRNDPGLTDDQCRGDVDEALHMRLFLNRHRIGFDAMFSYLRPRLLVDVSLAELKAKGQAPLVVYVHNPRDVEPWPADLKSAQVLRDVKLTVRAPDNIQVERMGRHRGSMIRAGKRRRYEFKLVASDLRLPLKEPLSVRVSCQRSPAAEQEISADTRLPRFQAQSLRLAKQSWLESGLRLEAPLRPKVSIKPLTEAIINPSLRIGSSTVRFSGRIALGQQLTISPGGRAEIAPTNLLADFARQLIDLASPTGFRVFDKGYIVAGASPHLAIPAGQTYRLTIEGRAEDGANSMVAFRFHGRFASDRGAPASFKIVSYLASRFTSTWSKAMQDVTPPKGTTHLWQIYFYRFGNKGRVSYGNVSLMPTSVPRDVSPQLQGRVPAIQPGRLNRVTYQDETGDRLRPKVMVRLGPDRNTRKPQP